jgi:hypothetical protein
MLQIIAKIQRKRMAIKKAKIQSLVPVAHLLPPAVLHAKNKL